MNKKGFSTIELLVSFVIVSFVAIAMFKTVVDLLDKINYYQEQAKMSIIDGNIANSIQKDLNQKKFYGVDICGGNCYDITYQDLSVRRLEINDIANTIRYGGITEVLPDNRVIYGALQINSQTLSAPIGKNDTILQIFIPIQNEIVGMTNDINIVYQYDSRDTGGLPEYVEKAVD